MKYLQLCKVIDGFYEGQIVQLIDYLEKDDRYIVLVSQPAIQGQLKQAVINPKDLKELTEEEMKEIQEKVKEQAKAEATRKEIIGS